MIDVAEERRKAVHERVERMSPYTRAFWDATEGINGELVREIERIRLLVSEIVEPPNRRGNVIMMSNHGATVARDRGTGLSGGDLPRGKPSAAIHPVNYQAAYDSLMAMLEAVQDIIACGIIKAEMA